MIQPIFYFAYGSNMNPKRMQKRCPGAVPLGMAKLPDYHLSERLYADIDFKEGFCVYGVLYCIWDKHIETLDFFEGYPRIYRRMWLAVEYQNEIVLAMTYEMTAETKRIREGQRYTKKYRRICSRGATFFNVPNSFAIRKKHPELQHRKEISMKTVKLITYGTLMTGECNHRFCANAVNITPCTIKGTLYDTGWGFPAFEQTGDTVVHAELIEIPFKDWKHVDMLEGYPRLYDRKLIQVTLADDSEDTGWVYIMNKLPASAKVIPSGDWKKRRENQ